MKETIILFQGDSITDGNRYKDKASEWDLNHQMGHGYAYMINGFLGYHHSDRNFRFYNKGVSGDSIDNLMKRWQEDTLDIRPDILSILIGANDCDKHIGKFPQDDTVGDSNMLKEYKNGLTKILKDAKTVNPYIRLVLCEPFFLAVGEGRNWTRWQALMPSIQRIVKEVSEEFDTDFVPLQEKFISLCEIREPSYWIWDGIHPTVCGHQMVAEAWMNRVKLDQLTMH